MTDPIQAQLIAARKNQILDAAAAVFAEKGFHPTTTRDIAKRAGISEGTIYNYFETKSALLLGVFDRMRASVIQENMPTTLPVNMPLTAFVRMFIQHPLMGMKDDGSALFRIVVSEMLVNDDLRRLYYEQVLTPTLAVAEGYLMQRAAEHGVGMETVQLIVRAMSSMIMGLMMQYSMGDPVLSERWDDLPDILADLWVNGLKAKGF